MLAALFGLTSAAIAVDYLSREPGLCNRGTAEAASIQFALPNGLAVLERLPRMGKAPELEDVDGPVTVVVFEGPHRDIPVFTGLQPHGDRDTSVVYDGVVCIVLPSGEVNYYANVDMTGLDLSGLTVDRRAE